MAGISELAAARSEEFVHFRGETTKADQYIKFYNPQGVDIFKHDPIQRERARVFLRSGKVLAVVPVRNEMGGRSQSDVEPHFFTLPSVLSHLEYLVGCRNILVVDADSNDASYEEAAIRGIETVKQSEIEDCYKGEEIAKDFGVEWPLRTGKGRTMLAATMYDVLVRRPQRQQVQQFTLFSDADIANMAAFDHPTWLAWVAIQNPARNLMEIRAAQPTKNSADVMHMINALQASNPVMAEYFQFIREYKWLLTGQFMKIPLFFEQAPNTLGYGIETVASFAAADFSKAWGKQVAQVEISQPCMDAVPTVEKTEGMVVVIITMLYAVNETLFKEGVRMKDMTVDHYKALNSKLREMEEANGGFVASIIPHTAGPNLKVPLTLDRLLPPTSYLIQKDYVDLDRVKKLTRQHYGRHFLTGTV